MLPMSSLNALGSAPGMPTAVPPQQAGGGLVSFGSMGIPGLSGGYAYPPGSEMSMFLDNLNGTVASAAQAPDGTSIIAWANGLAQQAALRQQQQAQQAQAAAAQASSGGNDLMQMLQSLLSMLLSQLNQKPA